MVTKGESFPGRKEIDKSLQSWYQSDSLSDSQGGSPDNVMFFNSIVLYVISRCKRERGRVHPRHVLVPVKIAPKRRYHLRLICWRAKDFPILSASGGQDPNRPALSEMTRSVALVA